MEIPLYLDEELNLAEWHEPEEETRLEDGLEVVRNVSRPSLTPYIPENAQPGSAGVIVAPGGAWHFLAWRHEGTQVCEWLNAQGIPAFLLKYRLIQTGDDFPACIGRNLAQRERLFEILAPLTPLIQEDVLRAVRLVRSGALDWQVDPHKVGVMGFSAGGNVTFLSALAPNPADRPDFAAPIYPAPYPPEMAPDAKSPPLFLLSAGDDEMAVGSCLHAFSAWKAAGVPAELHFYHHGGHGFGMNHRQLITDSWIERFVDWLRSSGF